MFRNILIGTAFTLVAASTSLTPAFAQAVPHNYPDRCKTAYENFKQAQWEKSHKTDQGNLGGAEGWDELADAAEKSAAKQTARAAEHAAEALKNPPGSPSANFWNKQATEAAGEAADWKKSAEKNRANAKKMRDEAKGYEDAAWKALMECLDPTAGTFSMVPSYEDFVNNDKPVEETTATAEQPEPEKKPAKKPARKVRKEEKKPKVAKVRRQDSAGQEAAQSFVRDVAVSVASQVIFGEISGMGDNGGSNKKHRKAKRQQMMEGQAMGEGRSRRKMKKNKMMSMF